MQDLQVEFYAAHVTKSTHIIQKLTYSTVPVISSFSQTMANELVNGINYWQNHVEILSWFRQGIPPEHLFLIAED